MADNLHKTKLFYDVENLLLSEIRSTLCKHISLRACVVLLAAIAICGYEKDQEQGKEHMHSGAALFCKKLHLCFATFKIACIRRLDPLCVNLFLRGLA